jgi:hypothetical protein
VQKEEATIPVYLSGVGVDGRWGSLGITAGFNTGAADGTKVTNESGALRRVSKVSRYLANG